MRWKSVQIVIYSMSLHMHTSLSPMQGIVELDILNGLLSNKKKNVRIDGFLDQENIFTASFLTYHRCVVVNDEVQWLDLDSFLMVCWKNTSRNPT